jgi:hypothetical protein
MEEVSKKRLFICQFLVNKEGCRLFKCVKITIKGKICCLMVKVNYLMQNLLYTIVF